MSGEDRRQRYHGRPLTPPRPPPERQARRMRSPSPWERVREWYSTARSPSEDRTQRGRTPWRSPTRPPADRQPVQARSPARTKGDGKGKHGKGQHGRESAKGDRGRPHRGGGGEFQWGSRDHDCQFTDEQLHDEFIWIPVCRGGLGLRAAPRDERDIEHWKELGMTHLVTLCKVPVAVPKFATSQRIHHLVLPLGSLVQTRGPKAEIRNVDWASLIAAISTTSDLLEAGASVVLHCFKGLHSTGVVGYKWSV